MATQPTKDKIISSSWELLEELPLTEFSMRKLASRLGMTVSSLYYHFSSKEALFAELIDKASLEIIFPANEKTWQDRLFVYGKNIYAVLEAYPNLAQLMMDYPPESENYLRLFDKLLMIVDDLKLSDDHKFYTINLFLNFIYTSKIDRDRLVEQPKKPLSTVKIPLVQLAPFLDKYWRTESLTSLGSSESFEFGLQLIISGIEKMLKIN